MGDGGALNRRVLNYVTFIVLMISTVLGYQFLWGLLFLYWTVPAYYSGRAFLLSDVARDEDPILFWAVQSAWFVLGGLLVVIDLYPILSGN